MLLLEAARRGVKVIAAHCGSRLFPWEVDYYANWARLAREFEHFYGDTAALNVPGRWYALEKALAEPALAAKLVHGSDWPIPPFPPPHRIGWEASWKLVSDDNWLRRDVLIKRELGLDQDYWHRAQGLLKIDPAKLMQLGSPAAARPL
jgi:hypothetical protein